MARLHEFHCLSQLTFLRQHHIRTPNCNSSSTSIFKSQLSPPCKHTRIFSNPRERVDNQPTNQPTNQRIKLTHCHPKIPLQRRSNVTTNDDERRRTTTNDDERRRTTTNDDARRRIVWPRFDGRLRDDGQRLLFGHRPHHHKTTPTASSQTTIKDIHHTRWGTRT